eukprot:gene5847-11812_t
MKSLDIILSSIIFTFSLIYCNYLKFSVLHSIILSLIAAYIPSYLDSDYTTDGRVWPAFQRFKFWDHFANYFKGQVITETPLDSKQLYIFCNFPHGACSLNHGLTMTDCCGMLSKIYTGERRDLAASIVFKIPMYREFLLYLGCVDASAKTANYNLSKHRSLLILIGGEKEQLMTVSKEHKIYISTRKGFVKLALQHGAHLVPM